MVLANGILSLVVLLVGLVIEAHLTGTALGSRLRAHADQEIARLGETRVRHRTAMALPRQEPPYWHRHGRPTLGWLPALVLAGAVVAAAGGGALLMLAIGNRLSLAGAAVSLVSLAVLGGWFAFVACSFYAIFRHGLREAVTDEQRQDGDQGARLR
jgi:hypothetical protein